jgi:hypothetical protein
MLAERLDTIRKGADKRIPPDKRAIMHRATDDLRASGILDGVIKVGDRLPAFALKSAFRAGGALVRASCERAAGPDSVPRQLVTLLRGRAVCFAASSGHPQEP